MKVSVVVKHLTHHRYHYGFTATLFFVVAPATLVATFVPEVRPWMVGVTMVGSAGLHQFAHLHRSNHVWRWPPWKEVE